MLKYRSKPVVIEAVQWFPDKPHSEVKRPGDTNCPLRYFDGYGRACPFGDDQGWVGTLEGGHVVSPGDWIIKGLLGELYPCKDEVFRKKYAAVEPDVAIDPLRELTIRAVFSRKSALDAIYRNHMKGFHGALNDVGFHIRAIAEDDQMKSLEDDEDESDDE